MTWALLLLALGMGLLLAEAFLPSGGLLLVLAFLCLAGGLHAAFRVSTTFGLGILAADLILGPVIALTGLYLWQKSDLAAKMMLRAPSDDEVTDHAAADRVANLLQRRGEALTPLRPTGYVAIDGRRFEGIAESGLIPAGASVVVVAARAGRLTVRHADEGRNFPDDPSS